ncbi:hypothetical protein [Streptomyces lavendulocolor]|uniref:hypothetical protein n=1 Tax=Streptomyces lavendulocolor TaxID=67316 RepID=UPI003C2B001F
MRHSQGSSLDSDLLTAAFPPRLAEDVRSALAVMPVGALPPADSFSVEVRGETVAIPTRMHHAEPDADAEGSLTGTQRLVLDCLYSRHGDGRVRERRARTMVASDEPWVAPFVVQLAGEYVVEILEVIREGLSGLDVPESPERRTYGEFIARNPAFYARTERRAVSYWSCFHRRKYPVFGTYPGGVLAEAFRAAASEHAGVRWPRHTPPGLPHGRVAEPG